MLGHANEESIKFGARYVTTGYSESTEYDSQAYALGFGGIGIDLGFI